MISNNFVTKSLVFKEDSGERFFEGLLTVEMVDRQGEVTMVDSLYKCLPIWMDRGGAISDTHSNRIVGKGINYAKTTLTDKEGHELPALKIIGKIFNHTQLDNEIWGKIKSGEYKGLSFGGATTSDATPVQQSDGSIAFHLKDIEMYEIAVCEDPAVPFALITATNDVAKSNETGDDYVVKDDDEDVIIKCEEKGCFISKADDKKPLNKPMRDDGDKKFKVYVKDPKTGNTVTVRFGDPNMEIRRDDPEARSSFRARHKCDQQNDKTSAAYWSCKMWEKSSTVSDNISKANWEVWLEKDLQQPDGGMRGLGGYNTSQQGADDIAQVSEVKSEDAKHEENYIKDNNKESDSNMADENKKPEEEVKAEHAEEEAPVEKTEEEIDDKNKAFDAISVQLKSIIEGQKSLGDRIKALETPTDLPLTPKVSDKDDIGAEVKAPDTYQSNSVQAGLDDDKSGEKKPEGDEGSLAMQEKSLVTKSSNTFTTETPRPSAALETIEKSSGKDYSPILKDARAQGYEGLSQVAQNILAGKYYTPTSDEVGTY